MKRNIFRNPDLQLRMEQDGFVTMPFLNQDEIRRLRLLFERNRPPSAPAYGFHVSLDDPREDIVRHIAGSIAEICRRPVLETFDRSKVFTSSFVIKESNPDSLVPVHQDWTFVDESKYCSLTCWIPLVAVNVSNGGLGVIKGSHKFYQFSRCSPSPQVPTPIGNHMFSIFPYLHIPDLSAGSAIIFDNRTFHGSPPNISGLPRIAAGIGITHFEADLQHNYYVPGEEVPKTETYRINPDFFFKYNNGKLSALFNDGRKPERLPLLSTSEFGMPVIDSATLDNWIRFSGNEVNPELEAMLPGGRQIAAKGEATNGNGKVSGRNGIVQWIRKIFG